MISSGKYYFMAGGADDVVASCRALVKIDPAYRCCPLKKAGYPTRDARAKSARSTDSAARAPDSSSASANNGVTANTGVRSSSTL